jgi:hypothetical protein
MFPVIPHFEKTAGARRDRTLGQSGHHHVAMRPQPLQRLCELPVGNTWGVGNLWQCRTLAEAASVMGNPRLIRQKKYEAATSPQCRD